MINEKTIILDGKGSAGCTLKSDSPEKDGILAHLPATAAVAARDDEFDWPGRSPRAWRRLRHLRSIESLTDLEVLLEQGRKHLLLG